MIGLENGSISIADVNTDGAPDVLLTGRDAQRTEYARLYLGDGTGSSTQANAGLTGVDFGSSSIADVNGDGHPDLLITGSSTATLYLGDGTGAFTEANAGLVGVHSSSSSIADVNGDGNPDLLITGSDGEDTTTTLYLGDGSGNFTEANAGLPGVYSGPSSIGDVNNDGRQDLLIAGWPELKIAGQTANLTPTSSLYLGRSDGTFRKANAGLTGAAGSTSITDVDNDGDSDLLIAGKDGDFPSTRLYVNRTRQRPPNRSPRFAETFHYDQPVAPGVPFARRIEVGDPDGDRLSIQAPDNRNVTVEDGGNGLADVTFTPDRSQRGRDVEISIEAEDSEGATASFSTTIEVPSSFLEASPAGLPGVGRSATSIADVDGDGMPDLLLTGRDSSGAPFSRLYVGEWGGGFSKADVGLDDHWGSSAIADVNQDGLLDILIAGPNTTLYLRNKDFSFSKADAGLPRGESPSIADVNRDGYPDVLLFSPENTGSLFLGTGRGTSREVDAGLPRIVNSATSIADVNGDGNPDVLLTGLQLEDTDAGLERTPIAKMYLGNGDGTFREAKAALEGASSGETSVADVNRDGHLDLLIMGGSTTLYLGNGDGTFRPASAGLIDVWGGSTAIADLNGDDSQDLLITGYNPTEPDLGLVSFLYVGYGNGGFERAHAGLATGWNSSASVADVDRDGDQDVLLTTDGSSSGGTGTTLGPTTLLYENLGQQGLPEPQLLKTYPNPARDRITVRFGVPERQQARLQVYDVLGRRVRTETFEANGERQVRTFDVKGLPSGVYFLRLAAGGQMATQKMTVVQ